MERMISMTFEETFLEGIDSYWKEFGFQSRSDFIRFACSQVMEHYQDKNFVLVEKTYNEWMMLQLKNKITNDIANHLQIDTQSIKKEMFEMVYQNTLKKLMQENLI
jgi:metal-responsive CopG/Arc/MetJ family transcriptional regulator